MSTLISGQRNMYDLNAAGIVPIDMEDVIHRIEFGGQDEAALFHLMNTIGGKKRTVYQWQYKVMEEINNKRVFASVSTMNATSLRLSIADADAPYIRRYSLIRNLRTDEVMFVVQNLGADTDTSGTDTGIIVQRAWREYTTAGNGSTYYTGAAGQNVVAGDRFMLIGSAREEGGLSETALSETPDISYNYCSFIRTPVETSGHSQTAKFYGGPDWPQRQKLAAIRHKFEVERTLWLSNRKKVLDPIGAAKYIYTTGGVMSHINNNTLDISSKYGGIITEKVMDNLGEISFLNGSDRKFLFCGGRFGAAMTAQARNRLVKIDTKSASSYGLSTISEYVTPYGTFNIIVHKRLFGIDPTVTGGTLASQAVVLDVDRGLKLAVYNGKDTKLYPNVQENDRDGQKDEWRTTVGLDMHGYGLDHPYNVSGATVPEEFGGLHAKLTGFSSY